MGFVNGIAIPTDGFQHSRLTCKTEIIGIKNPTKSTNEKEWIEVKNKSKKPSNLARLKEFGKIDRKVI